VEGRYTAITLEALGLEKWSDLYEMDTAEVIRLMDEKNVPLHPGDTFLAVLVLRGVRELGQATSALDRGTERLVVLTRLLLVVAVVTLAIAVIALFAA
jgi:hypothetical protein